MNSIKNRLIFQAAFGIVAAFLIAGSANRVQSEHHDQVPNQCSIERKNQYYKDFEASYEGDSKDQAKALEAAKNTWPVRTIPRIRKKPWLSSI